MNVYKHSLLLLGTILSLASCEADLPYRTETDSKNGARIFIAKANSGFQNLTIFPFTETERSFSFGVGYGAVGLPANDINVKFSVDRKALDSINTVRQISALPPYAEFPTNAYAIENTEVTIPKGELSSNLVKIKYFPNKFDATKSYLLPLSITDASGYSVNSATKTIFLVAPKVEEIVASTTGWTATASSEQTTGESTGLASAVIDGNLNTIWHSRYSPGPTTSYPHWLAVDMLKSTYVTKVAIAPRQNNANGFKKFNLEGSLDGTTWVTLGSNLTFDPANKSYQQYPITPQNLRFMKITMLEGLQALTFFAELQVYRY